MELLLYIVGPVLLLVLPLLPVLGAVGLAYSVKGRTAVALPGFLIIAVATAVVSPSSAQFSSATEWPAPWGIAIFFGPAPWSLKVYLFLLLAAVVAFLVASALLALFRSRRDNAR